MLKTFFLTLLLTVFTVSTQASECSLNFLKDGRVIKGDVTRFLLTETPEGRKILLNLAYDLEELKLYKATLEKNIKESTGTPMMHAKYKRQLKKFKMPTVSDSDEAIYAYRKFLVMASEDKEKALEPLLEQLRYASHAIERSNKSLHVTPKQKKLLEKYASHNLKLDRFQHLKTEKVASGKKEVAQKMEIEFKEQTQDIAELFPYKAFKAFDKKGKVISGPQFHKRVFNFFSDMRQCMKNMPKKAKMKKLGAIIAQQVGVSMTFSAWGYTSGALLKGEEIDWANMPVDLGVSAISAAADPILAVSASGIIGNYLKMLGWTLAKSELEVALYNFSPLTKTYGHDKNYVGLERFKYSADWGALSAAAKMGLFNMLLGLSCMYPNNTMAWISTGIQFGYRGISSSGYFLLRNDRFDKRGILKPKGEENIEIDSE